MNQPTVAIIGTGVSGLCAAIQVKKQLGVKAQLYEMTSDIGGTWRDNTYPGCACDIPSSLYSYSFELNSDWSHHYSPQNEIYEYLKNVARKYNIYEQTKFKTEVIRIEWIQEDQLWKVDSKSIGGNHPQPIVTEYFNYVFAGLGNLRIPNIPPQFGQFTGKIVHTALWDASIDFTNKKIAVIGSGASAIQVIPELRKAAKHLISYQRTPAWVFPRRQFAYHRIVKFLLKRVPFLMRLFRSMIFFQHELYFLPLTAYKSLLGRITYSTFNNVVANRLEKVGRPDLIPILTPTFKPGCKRIIKSETYFEALAEPNVTVVPRAVEDVQGDVLVDSNGDTQQIDILVLATGFNVHGFIGNLEIYGRDSLSLKDKWNKSYPDTYKGTTIHGFPNFFLIHGPGTALAHNSAITVIECQVQYAVYCMKHAIEKNLVALEPKLTAQDAYTADLKRKLDGSVWKSGCDSWYLNEDGDASHIWPATTTRFWWNTLSPEFKNFIEYRK